ncbi:MAG: GNAT family N-acyltransferase [Burkholderiaceae bacterium]
MPAHHTTTPLRAHLPSWPQPPGTPPPCPVSRAGGAGPMRVSWARHQDAVRQAQRLRFDVFCGEMGARPAPRVAGHDADIFDDFCEHLLVHDTATEQLLGTCRVLTPTQARRIGSTCSDTEFDLTRLRSVRDDMVEVGRGCVRAGHRTGTVAATLWGALAGFMHDNQLGTLIGCASMPMQDDPATGLLGGVHAVASIWTRLQAHHLASAAFQVRPRLPLPIDDLDCSLQARPPALIRASLRLGATVLGPPAWDPDLNTANLPMMLRLADVPAAFRHAGARS